MLPEKSSVGNCETASASFMAIAGNRGTAISKSRGFSVAGDYGHAITGEGGVAKVGKFGQITIVDGNKIVTGFEGIDIKADTYYRVTDGKFVEDEIFFVR
jgi:hypothetical protein